MYIKYLIIHKRNFLPHSLGISSSIFKYNKLIIQYEKYMQDNVKYHIDLLWHQNLHRNLKYALHTSLLNK